MDWDIEPTPTSEFVTINRGAPAADESSLLRRQRLRRHPPVLGPRPWIRATARPTPTDRERELRGQEAQSDHGARFTFSSATLSAAGGDAKQFFLYYGAAGNEADADAAVSAAALEVFSYGQPSRRRRGRVPTPAARRTRSSGASAPSAARAVIPPTLTLTPEAATSAARQLARG